MGYHIKAMQQVMRGKIWRFASSFREEPFLLRREILWLNWGRAVGTG